MISELPLSWVWATVADVAHVQLGRQRSPQHHAGEQMRPYLRAANITWQGISLDDIKTMNFNDVDFAKYKLEAGDILLNEASGSPHEVGKPAIWRNELEDCCFQNTLLRLRPQLVDRNYVYWYCYASALTGRLGEAGRGVNIRHLGKRGLAQFRLPVAPLAEQQRIVAAIEEHFSRLDAAKDAITTAQAKIEASRRSVLAEAFTGQLVPQDPTDEPASALLERIAADRRTEPAARMTNSSPSPMMLPPNRSVPPDWMATTIGDVFEIVGGATPRTDNSEYWDGDIPWVTPDDLSRHSDVQIFRGRRSITDAGFASTSAHMLPQNSVLFSSRASIGYTAIAANPLCTNQGFKSLIPPCGVEPLYVYWFLRYATPTIRERASGTTFKEVSKKRMAAVPFILPPSNEQRRIVAAIEEHFSHLDAANDAITAAQARIEASRRSVLAEAFSGRLVPQDQNDEPASALLERIASSKAGLRAGRGRRSQNNSRMV